MHVMSPVFCDFSLYEGCIFCCCKSQYNTCMIESQLRHWEYEFFVHSVQSSNRKFRIYDYFYPFEDTSALVKAHFLPRFFFFLVRPYHCARTQTHSHTHTRVMALSTPARFTRPPQPNLQYNSLIC